MIGQPLNSFMSIDPGVPLADLKGKSVGITGVPADHAALESAGLADKVRVVNVGATFCHRLLYTRWMRCSASIATWRNRLEQRLHAHRHRSTASASPATTAHPRGELGRLRSPAAYRDVVENFVNAFLEGTDEARANPDPLAPGHGRGHRLEARSWPPRFPRPSSCSGTAA